MRPHGHKHPESRKHPSDGRDTTCALWSHYSGLKSAQGRNLGFSHKKQHQMRARKGFMATQLGLPSNSQVMSSSTRKGTWLCSHPGLVAPGRASHSQAVLKGKKLCGRKVEEKPWSIHRAMYCKQASGGNSPSFGVPPPAALGAEEPQVAAIPTDTAQSPKPNHPLPKEDLPALIALLSGCMLSFICSRWEADAQHLGQLVKAAGAQPCLQRTTASRKNFLPRAGKP